MNNGPIIREIQAKSILSKSGIPGTDYCINAYVGCSHACVYCYATFMKKYTGHTEPWGAFVDVKVNAAELLRKQLQKAKRGHVMISSVTDAYQPIEVKYRLTRQCLEILFEHQFPVGVLTKSPLVLRDLDIIKGFDEIEVGITISTDDEVMRKIFEPGAPPIEARINTLRKLKESGVKTYVFIGPMLPMNPEVLSGKIGKYADSILISRMNYANKTAHLFKKLGMMQWLDKSFAEEIRTRIKTSIGTEKVTDC
ncbi:MAG: radical SAM protein [Nitrospirae bacterium]|nr:radical SAM protein [Nitrospirota bacterium]